jgi:hypothetical protein
MNILILTECSGALELVEPGTFRDLALEAKGIAQKMQKGEAKNVPLEEIEKDVTRTMPLNFFFRRGWSRRREAAWGPRCLQPISELTLGLMLMVL